MRNNSPFYVLIVFVILALVGLVYFISSRTAWSEEYFIDEDEPYGVYVFHELLQRSLGEEIIPIEEGLADSLAESENNRTLVFFGNRMYLDSAELVEIQDFVERGNNVFIASERFNDELLDSLFVGQINELRDQYIWEYDEVLFEEEEVDYDSYPEVDYEEEYYEEEYYEEEELEPHSLDEEIPNDSTLVLDSIDIESLFDERIIWYNSSDYLLASKYDSSIFVTLDPSITRRINGETLSEEEAAAIPKKPIEVEKVVKNYAKLKGFKHWKNGIENKSELEVTRIGGSNIGDVFIQIKSGKGSYYLHSVPMAFSNYHLLRKGNFDYFNQVYQQVDFKNILWDESSKKYKRVFSEKANSQEKEDLGRDLRSPNEGPLNYILNQPALRNAWFFGLGLLVIYFIFGVRRKQKQIRFIEPPKNTSIEFAETLGHMFRQSNNHHSLMKIKKQVFFEFIRERYAIKFLHVDSKEKLMGMIKQLSVKSGIQQNGIEEIFSLFNRRSEDKSLQTYDLIKLHKSLEEFYRNCK
ncbi:MAG: DUF4350 domain-containing protein [Flavobacteriales bacterium]|nr:DUF4350 domain-containing protein [Flavobacteriales bacterium]